MPPSPRYRIVFRGEIQPGTDSDQTKDRLQRLLKADTNTITRLFSGKKVTIKKDLSKPQALHYQRILQNQGAIFYIEPMDQAAQPQKPAIRDTLTLQPKAIRTCQARFVAYSYDDALTNV